MSHHHSHGMSRRGFLGRGACAALSTLPLVSTLLNLRLANAAVADTGDEDYKALVCVFLFGGNDSFNMLVPTLGGAGAGTYAEYAATRADLALPLDSLLRLRTSSGAEYADADGRTFGLHPGMPELQALFAEGKLGLVANVGSLVRPGLTVADYQAGRYLPLGLFSHSDQQEQWQTSTPDRRAAIGWGGRAADLILTLDAYRNQALLPVSMNISIAGSNVFQSGDAVFPYGIGTSGAVALSGYGATSGVNQFRTLGVDSLLEQEYQNLLERTFVQNTKRSLEAQASFKTAVDAVNLATVFPANNSLAAQLKMVARVIGARQTLGMKRQTFFVSLGGWDHHDELINAQAGLLPQVSQALAAFWQSLGELGVQNKVTTFEASDFARTLKSNQKGSDHAWGANTLVMGGAVAGGKIHGRFPGLNLTGNPLDVGRGRFIPTTAVDEFARDLLRWFGVDEGRMTDVLPNIRNFRSATDPLLGIMS